MHSLSKTLVLAASSALVPTACGTVGTQAPQALPMAPAPVSYDGHVAGEATDHVFMRVPDNNPQMPGIALRAGESLQLAGHYRIDCVEQDHALTIIALKDLDRTPGRQQLPVHGRGQMTGCV